MQLDARADGRYINVRMKAAGLQSNPPYHDGLQSHCCAAVDNQHPPQCVGPVQRPQQCFLVGTSASKVVPWPLLLFSGL